MVQLEMLMGVLEFFLGLQAQVKAGLLGVLSLTVACIALRARHTRTAVGAAVLFVILMSQT
ncbi:hypothetical protein AB5J56_24510 [Streptomyces sp. R21]|uniref:Uncharacterized protein n=1 Tax=Streptomyces sp. R21 TaxID=3238627 RepID=A0AB39PCT9_9ACTN